MWMNEFGDLTSEEYEMLMMGLPLPSYEYNDDSIAVAVDPSIGAPSPPPPPPPLPDEYYRSDDDPSIRATRTSAVRD